MLLHLCSSFEVSKFRALSKSRQIHNRESLGQTSDEYAIYRQIWDGRETVKSQTVWDFPDIWKPGFRAKKSIHDT